MLVTKCIFQSGVGGLQAAALASSFRLLGQERSPKFAPQHAPTVRGNYFLKPLPNNYHHIV